MWNTLYYAVHFDYQKVSIFICDPLEVSILQWEPIEFPDLPSTHHISIQELREMIDGTLTILFPGRRLVDAKSIPASDFPAIVGF